MTTAFQNSYLRRILLVIAALWGQSGVCALLDRLDRAFPRWLAGSAVLRLFARDGAATRALSLIHICSGLVECLVLVKLHFITSDIIYRKMR